MVITPLARKQEGEKYITPATILITITTAITIITITTPTLPLQGKPPILPHL